MSTEDELWRAKFSNPEGGSRDGYRPSPQDSKRTSGTGRPMRPRITTRASVYSSSNVSGEQRPRRPRIAAGSSNDYGRTPAVRTNAPVRREGSAPRREGGYSARPFGGDNTRSFRKEGAAPRKPMQGKGPRRPRTADYNPNAKYSMKKQIEYKETHIDPNEPIRLNRFLANAGVCSRREADDFIAAGVVSVNGKVVTELGTKVLRSDNVVFHNQPVMPEKKVYILLNKPKDYANKFSVAVDSHDIKVADNGETIYVIAGNKLAATIVISGTRDFGIPNVAADALAETVTITLADGTSQTVADAVVASRFNNGALGVATRGSGLISFTAISLMPFDSIEIPGNEPEAPVENYNVPQSAWTVSGHCPQIVGASGHANSPMVAAGGIESGALLHQGSIGVGEVDLSKYSKVVIKFGVDNSGVTMGHYDANANNRIMLVNADVNMVMSPNADQVIAGATYTPQGWALVEIEIDLTGVDYNGPVYVTYDTLPGTFMLFGSVEFVA